MTVTPDMTEHGITKSLRDAKSGNGFCLGDDYRNHLIACGWMTKDCAITREGMLELERRTEAASCG